MGEKSTLFAIIMISLFIVPILSIEAKVTNLPTSPYSQEMFPNILLKKSDPYHYEILSPRMNSVQVLAPENHNPASTRGIKYVGGLGPGNYTTIQAAINDSTAGDTIYVYSGVYKECPQINTSGITLIGEDQQSTIIDGGRAGSVVFMRADAISIQGFTIQNSSSDIFNDIGIAVVNPARHLHGIQISHCIFHDSGRGVYYSNVTDSSISDCIMQDLSGTSISVIFSSSNITIENCLIHDCGEDMGGMAFPGGIFVTGLWFNCSNVITQNNTIYKVAAYGVILQCTINGSVLRSTMHDCSWTGITVSGQNFTIRENTIAGCSMNGIMTGGCKVDISFNRISGCGTDGYFDGGILLQDSRRNAVLMNNSVENNTPYGIYMIRSPGAKIFYNNFMGNTNNEFVLDTNWSRWRGNYWDDWKGIGPKLIVGWQTKLKYYWVSFDWHPARKPYPIPRT